MEWAEEDELAAESAGQSEDSAREKPAARTDLKGGLGGGGGLLIEPAGEEAAETAAAEPAAAEPAAAEPEAAEPEAAESEAAEPEAVSEENTDSSAEAIDSADQVEEVSQEEEKPE